MTKVDRMGWGVMGARTPLALMGGPHGPETSLGLFALPLRAIPHDFNLQIKLGSSPSK